MSDPSMHVTMTSMACGQRRMVGRNSSITDRLWSVGQAVQTMTVNGRSVAGGEEVNVPWPVRPRRSQSQVLSFFNPFDRACWHLLVHKIFQLPGVSPVYGNSAISRALLIAVLICRCCRTVRPVTSRERILPRPEMSIRSVAVSL